MAGTSGETLQALIPLVHHAGRSFHETRDVLYMVVKLRQGSAHSVTYLLNESALPAGSIPSF